MLPPITLEKAIEKIVREEWGRILASLVKTLSDIQLAEDCLQDAIVSAMSDWPHKGLPQSPAAWLITTARRKALDRFRRRSVRSAKQAELSHLLDLENQPHEPDVIPDKRLEMIFTCCHPALEQKTRVALTLRTLGGLTTDEIARAFLDNPDAMAQRLVRAKKKIALAKIPYQIPDDSSLGERLASVLQVIYLIFNQGYSTGGTGEVMRHTLSDEAVRLARIVHGLLPNEPEVEGLLALMLLHNSRRHTRVDKDGRFVPLEHQNRNRWNRSEIAQGIAILTSVLPKGMVGPYQIQAAISALHAEGTSWEETDWRQIEQLYRLLYELQPSGVVKINHAVALSFANTPTEGLALLQHLSDEGGFENYQPFFAAKADLLARSGDNVNAALAYRHAIALTNNEQEKEHLLAKSALLD